MQIGVREAAGLLGVTEKTLMKWIRDDSLPAVKVGGQFRFNRTELLEWATTRQIPVSSELFPGTKYDGENCAASLRSALQAGGIRYDVPGTDRHSVLENTLGLMPIPCDVDRAFLLQILEAREDLSSTGIGDGIAIPHVRNPIVLAIPEPVITLAFLERGIEFGAIDGRPVHTLFMMISPTVNSHLGILSRLAFALRQPAFMGAVSMRCAGGEILDQAGNIDGVLASRVNPGRGE